LFILTTLDAGTRVGRYLLQDVLGNIWKPLGDVRSANSNVLASSLVVAGWGYFLIQGVRDPLGGINSLWPLFGIANQLLASIALCLATTIILKMHLAPKVDDGLLPSKRKPWFALITLVPLMWLLCVTLTAGVQKIGHPNERIGFLSQVKVLREKTPALQTAVETARQTNNADAIKNAEKALRDNRTNIFNNLLDAVVAAVFLALVVLIVLLSAREWILLCARRRVADLRESPPVWLPDYAIAEGQPLRVGALVAIAFALAKELSGEAAVERSREASVVCLCPDHAGTRVNLLGAEPSDAYVAHLQHRYSRINRCC
jgi:carbon starvation protein